MFPPLFATNRGEIQMLHHKKMIIRDVWEVYSVYIYIYEESRSHSTPCNHIVEIFIEVIT